MKAGKIACEGSYNALKNLPSFKQFCQEKHIEDDQEAYEPSVSDSEPDDQNSMEMNSRDKEDQGEESELEDLAHHSNSSLQNQQKELQQQGSTDNPEGNSDQQTESIKKEGSLKSSKNQLEEENSIINKHNQQKKSGKITSQETKSKGVVSIDSYLYYAKQLGWRNVLLVALFFIGFVIFTFAMDYYISIWMKDSLSLANQSYYPLIYLGMIFVLIAILVGRTALLARTFTNGGYKILKDLMLNILRRKMSFFDTTPIGQILTRSNDDAYNIDLQIPLFVPLCLTPIFMLIGICIFITIISPLQLVLVVLIFGLMMRSFSRFTKVSIEFQRMVMLAAAPVSSSITELLKGMSTVRVYRRLGHLEQLIANRCDVNMAAIAHDTLFYQWITDSIHLLGTCLLLVTLWFLALGKIFK